MKSTVNAAEFTAALKKASAALRPSAIPQFQQVRVQFADDACRLSASNLEMWLTIDIPAHGDQFSFVFQNTKIAQRAIQHFRDDMTLELCGREETLVVSCGDKAVEFPTLTDDLHQEPPEVVPTQRYAVNADALYRRVKNVAYASRERPERPLAAGVRFQDKRLWCVDGFRLALHEDAALDVKTPFMASAKTLENLKSFGDADGELLVGEKHAAIRTQDMRLTCRLIDGKDDLHLENVLPKSSKETYAVDRKQYLDALRFLRDCVSDRRRLPVIFDGGQLVMHGVNGTYRAKIDVLEGTSEVVYGFNVDYMKEALEQFSDEKTVKISATGMISPIILTADGGATAMVLPVNITKYQSEKAA